MLTESAWLLVATSYIAHLYIVGGGKKIVTEVESPQKEMLEPLQYVEKALDAAPAGAWDSGVGTIDST